MAYLRETRLIPRNSNVKFGYIDAYMSYTDETAVRLKTQKFRLDLLCNVIKRKENFEFIP